MNEFIKLAITTAINQYQKWVSPLLPPRCRFYPSCSEYALVSIQRHSLSKALFKICLRLIKCNPLHSGGVDWP